MSRQFTCKYCNLSLKFFNKLFQHIKQQHDFKYRIKHKYIKVFYVNESIIDFDQIIDKLELIQLDIKAIIDIDLVFRLLYYIIIFLEFV